MTADAAVVAEYRLGPVAELPIGEGRAFAVGGEQVAVFRLRDGRVRALSAVCPHAGGPIADGQIDARVVVCPLHQYAYDLDTGCATAGREPLRRYPVRVDESGDVVVAVVAVVAVEATHHTASPED